MVKVLLVEPERILQQAISLALFPDYEVQVEKTIAPAIGALEDYDLLIVDGSALRETGQLTPEVSRAIQGCKTPMLWLEEAESSHAPRHDKVVVIKKPIEREAFQTALADLIPVPGGGRDMRVSRPVAREKKKDSKQESFGFIDLVDVVEEEASPKQPKKPQRKSK